MRFYGEMRVQGSGPLDGARFDALAYALAEIEDTDPAISDVDLTASLAQGRVTASMVVEQDDLEDAVAKLITTVRTAIYPNGDIAGSWKFLAETADLTIRPADRPPAADRRPPAASAPATDRGPAKDRGPAAGHRPANDHQPTDRRPPGDQAPAGNSPSAGDWMPVAPPTARPAAAPTAPPTETTATRATGHTPRTTAARPTESTAAQTTARRSVTVPLAAPAPAHNATPATA